MASANPTALPNLGRLVEQVAVDVVRGWLGRRGILTDQSATGLPDFTIAYTDGRSAVGEVTWHADPQVEQMWGVTLRQDTPQQVPLQAGEGIWGAQLVGAPNITRLHTHLPGLVARLNAALTNRIEPVAFPNAWRLRRPDVGALADEAAMLGIGYLSKAADEPGPGHVTYFPPFQATHDVGAPDDLASWIEAVLAEPRYADVTRKLLAVDADERHVFVMAGSATAAQVENPLQRLASPIPGRDPHLPEGITHIWLNSRFIDPDHGHVTALWSAPQGWQLVASDAAPLPPP